MSENRQSWWSYLGGTNTADVPKSTTTNCEDSRFPDEESLKANRIVSIKPSRGTDEHFKAVVSGELTSGVDIKVGPTCTTVGFTTDSQGKTFYKMPDVRNDHYKFVPTDDNPKIETGKGDGVISFVLKKDRTT